MPEIPTRGVTPTVLSSLSLCSLGDVYAAANWDGVIANLNSSAGRGIFVYFNLPTDMFVESIGFVNGNSSLVGNNFEVGVYTREGRKYWSSGSQAGTATSTNQIQSYTANINVPAGGWYFGFSMSGAENIAFANIGGELLFPLCFLPASAFPFPATIATGGLAASGGFAAAPIIHVNGLI